MNKRLFSILSILAMLTVVLLVPLSVSARLVGDDFVMAANIPRQNWSAGVDYEPLGGQYAVSWLYEESLGGHLYPYFGWYTTAGQFSTQWRLSSYPLSASSSYPDVACSTSQGHCLVTWVIGGTVYAQRVAVSSGNSAIWTVNTGGKGLSSVAAAGTSEYVVAWSTTDGQVSLRYVHPTNGPTGYDVVNLLKPSGCSQMDFPRIAYSESKDAIAVAFNCFMEGQVYVEGRDYGNDLAYAWTFAPVSPVGEEYAPDVAADKNGSFMLVWATSFTSSSRIYGQRFYGASGQGSAFGVLQANEEQSGVRMAYDAVHDEYLVVFGQDNNIYSARLKSDGSPAGAPYAITTASGQQLKPQVAYNSNINFYLVDWTDRRGSVETVYGRWFEPEPILGDKDPFSNETEPGGTNHYQAPVMDGQWQAVGLRPGLGSDFDLYLYDGPDYANELVSSLGGTEQVDIVLLDGRQSSLVASFLSATQYAGDNYVVEYAPLSAQITQDNHVSNHSLDSESVLRTFEIYGQAGQQLSIQLAPGAADVGVALFDGGSGAHQSLAQAQAWADTGGAGQAESLVYVPAQNGWYGLVVWKNDANADSVQLSVDGAGGLHSVYLPSVIRNR